jgi:hypothetical protein
MTSRLPGKYRKNRVLVVSACSYCACSSRNCVSCLIVPIFSLIPGSSSLIVLLSRLTIVLLVLLCWTRLSFRFKSTHALSSYETNDSHDHARRVRAITLAVLAVPCWFFVYPPRIFICPAAMLCITSRARKRSWGIRARRR